MFDLKNTKKYKTKSVRILKGAAIIVATAQIVLYAAFIIVMLVTKLGILSAFVHTKPIINSAPVIKEPAYDYINYDFYYKRFNWLYDEEYYKLYFVYDFDLNSEDNSDYTFDRNFYSKFEGYWFCIDLKELETLKLNTKYEFDPLYIEELIKNYSLEEIGYNKIEYWTYKTQENFSKNLYKEVEEKEIYKKIFPDILHMLATKESVLKIPSGITIIIAFGTFMLISSLLKIFSIAKSYKNKKLEFEYGTLIVKLSCIFDILGIIALTYVFFFLCLWDILIFYNVIEPSLIYYLLFALPIIGLSTLYTSLFTRTANEESKFK